MNQIEFKGSTAELVKWLREADLPEQFCLRWQRHKHITDSTKFYCAQDRIKYAADQEKIEMIWELEKVGVLGREEMPVNDGCGGTKYWHWPVMKPEQLPDLLKADYEKFGEVRW